MINEITGEIKVSQDAILDIQENGDIYEIQLQAIDRGTQGHFAQTAQTTGQLFVYISHFCLHYCLFVYIIFFLFTLFSFCLRYFLFVYSYYFH